MATRKHPYGAAVVGKEEAAKQREIKKKKANIYGPKVIGTDATEPKKEKKKAPAKKAPDTTPPEGTETTPPEGKEPTTPEGTTPPEEKKEEEKKDPNAASMTVGELEELLEEDPSRLDDQIDAELGRTDGARKGALRAFIATENKREDGPRSEILDLLERALAGN